MPKIRLHPSAAILSTPLGPILRTDLTTFQLGGPDASIFVERIAPLLDGTHTPETIAASLEGYAPTSVTSLLATLTSRGLVLSEDAAPRSEEAFFRAFRKDPSEASRRIAEARVLVVGNTRWGSAAASSLQSAGVSEVHQAATYTCSCSWTLIVAALDPEDASGIETVARSAHLSDVPSLWSHLSGNRASVGPLVTPGKTACRVCASSASLNPTLAGEAGIETLEKNDPRLPARAARLGSHVAMEALKAISGYTDPILGGRVSIHDLDTLTSSLHTLVRLPWCRVCGEGRPPGPAYAPTVAVTQPE